MCSCLSPLVGGTSVLEALVAHLRTPEDGRDGSTPRTLVSGEDEAEDINALSFGMQWTCTGAQAVSEVSDFGHIGVYVVEVVSLAGGSAQAECQVPSIAFFL